MIQMECDEDMKGKYQIVGREWVGEARFRGDASSLRNLLNGDRAVTGNC